ncbi:fibronectin type III domain-containing protein [Corynebacterium breve]|uniref:Fibronectin type III domain-containing protein n=1 Tax=Corynebacterium breve TaxID=3049799 RepID=A0ABY8VBW8_9CORY|nr:fibronectin type III domain-containing protein [Corynebacterium breve]WIM67166.1 fibronectin type III domain-containing protein [Corynebacterium breve]
MGRTIPVAIMTALAVGATSIAGVPVAQAQSHPIYRTMLGIGQDESSATFSWRSDYAGQEFVRVTPVDQPDATQQVPAYDVDAGADLFDSKHAEITGLTPATSYSYQIGSDEGGWSNAYEFTTDDGDDTWNFLAFADAQIGVDLKIEENGQAWRDATRTATQTYPDSAFLMHLGDQVDGWGDQIAQYAQFFSPSEVRSYRTGVLYGNHEDYQLGQKYFDEHYNLPNETDNNANYFFEHNNALFIGINSMSSAPADIQRHQEFIRQVVAQRGGDKAGSSLACTTLLSPKAATPTTTMSSLCARGLPLSSPRLVLT